MIVTVGWVGAGARSYRFRSELRQRRLAWLGVAVIIGLSAGVVLALLAGARRSDTAIDRFVAGAAAHDEVVISGVEGTFDFAALDMDEVAALPGVADSQEANVLAGAGHTDDGLLIDSTTVNFLADPSGRVGDDLDRFKVIDGRLADPSDPLEVVAAFRAAESFDLEAGSTIDLNVLDGEELGQIFGGAATFEELADIGTDVTLQVVGVVVEPGGLAPPAPDDTTNLWMTPAADEAFVDSRVVKTMLVALEDGAAGEQAFLDQLDAIGGGQPVLTISTAADAHDADRGLAPIVRAQYLTALLLVLVTGFLAGQVLSRQAAAESGNDSALRALGWTRRDLLRLRVTKAIVIGALAALVAAGVAVALSPLFPLGLARIVEPDPGVDVDGLVLALGILGVLLLATGLASLIGWWSLRRGAASAARRPSRLASALSAAGAPPSIAVGTNLAVQAGPGGGTAPIVSAGATVAIGLGTVAAVLAFMASLGHLTDSPALYGWNWDVELGQEFSEALSDEDVAWLRDDPAVADLAVGTTASLSVDGERIDAYAVDDVVGAIEPSLLRGRRAEAPDEIVVAPGVGDVGDVLTVQFADAQAELEVVGQAAVPRSEAMLTFQGLLQLAPRTGRQTALVELRDDADLPAFVDRSFTELGYTGQDIATPDLPDDLVNFGRVDSAPAVVAAAMSLVAVATLVHALVTTVRRRRGDLAVLHALGLTRGQVRVAVGWQAAVIVVVAILLAVPAGVVAGRWGWILFARELEVISRPIVPLLLLLGTAAVALLLAEAIALLAIRWSSRSAAAVLRAE